MYTQAIIGLPYPMFPLPEQKLAIPCVDPAVVVGAIGRFFAIPGREHTSFSGTQ